MRQDGGIRITSRRAPSASALEPVLHRQRSERRAVVTDKVDICKYEPRGGSEAKYAGTVDVRDAKIRKQV
jgi:hypothetical protein